MPRCLYRSDQCSLIGRCDYARPGIQISGKTMLAYTDADTTRQILHRRKCGVQRTHKRFSNRQALYRRPQILQEVFTKQRFDGAMGDKSTLVRFFYDVIDTLIDLDTGSTLKNGSRFTIQLTERRSYRVTRKVRAEASVSFDDCQRLLSSDPGKPRGMYSSQVSVPMLCRFAVIQSLSSTTIQQSSWTFSDKYVVNHLYLWYHIFKSIVIRVPVLSKPFWIPA